MRALFPLLLAGCLSLGACSTNPSACDYGSSPLEYPSNLRFNRAGSGFIRSPYDPSAGLVDVRRLSPGDLAYCPYTGRVFVVPPCGSTKGISYP